MKPWVAVFLAVLLTLSAFVGLAAISAPARASPPTGAPYGPVGWAWSTAGPAASSFISDEYSPSYAHIIDAVFIKSSTATITAPSSHTLLRTDTWASAYGMREYSETPTGANVNQQTTWSISTSTIYAIGVASIYTANLTVKPYWSNSTASPTFTVNTPNQGMEYLILFDETVGPDYVNFTGAFPETYTVTASAAAEGVYVLRVPITGAATDTITGTAGSSASWAGALFTATNYTYSQPFAETGLTGSPTWSVSVTPTYGGSSSASGTSTDLYPHTANGTAMFVVTPPTGWTPRPAAGAFTITGAAGAPIAIAFASNASTIYYNNQSAKTSTPSNLTVESFTSTQVALGWSNPSGIGTVLNDTLLQASSCAMSSPTRTSLGVTTADVVSGLSNDSVYAFEVQAWNATAHTTSSCIEVVTTPTSGNPNAPLNLTVEDATNTFVALGWTNPPSASANDTIFQGSSCSSLPTKYSTGGLATTYVVGSLQPNTTYAFEVESWSSSSAHSGQSLCVEAHTYPNPVTEKFWDNSTYWDNTTHNYYTNHTYWDNTTKNYWDNTTVTHWDNTTNNYRYWTNTTKFYYDNTTNNYWDNTTKNYYDNTTKNYWTNTTKLYYDNTTKNYYDNTTKTYWDNTSINHWTNTTHWDNSTFTHWDNTTEIVYHNSTVTNSFGLTPADWLAILLVFFALIGATAAAASSIKNKVEEVYAASRLPRRTDMETPLAAAPALTRSPRARVRRR